MKRISFVLATLALFTVASVRAEDAATEERLNKLAGQIEDLKAGQEALRRQVESLSRELDAVREQAAKPSGNYAAVEDLNRLKEALKEVDRKRMEDADKTHTELLRLGNLLAAGPAPARKSSSRSSERASTEKATGDTQPKDQEKGFGDYVVQKGDTLSLIAQAYRDKNIKVTPEQIVKANPGLVPERLRPGQKLWIPAPQ